MYSVVFYVPESHVEIVKNAIFDAGGGRIGDYDRCAWQTSGQGQFRPLAGSQPFAGEVGRVEIATEMRVELVVEDERIDAAVDALIEAHPYEEPAYHYFRVEFRVESGTPSSR